MQISTPPLSAPATDSRQTKKAARAPKKSGPPVADTPLVADADRRVIVPAASPFVKWVGGKRQLLPAILAQAPPRFDRYIEPFVGGGALALALGHGQMLLGDANTELMAAYAAVRDDVDGLMALLDRHRAAHAADGAAYFYAVRAQVASDLSPVEQAARLIYLNKTCFNGLYRVNRMGQFNTPYGKHDAPVLYDRANLLAASRALQGARLHVDDYVDFLDENARAGDFIYLDPPYEPVGRYSDFKRYTKEQFRVNDQEVLAELYPRLVARGCYPLLSNSDTPRTRELYADFAIVTVYAARAINKNGQGRGAIPEILVTPQPSATSSFAFASTSPARSQAAAS